ncbi:hypothetical protein [uncultured Roseobacter sp.]|uniref:hypothetical protein n=1 Tax=uncultured Roseobacter sp. TaxID=114847 RepID=UPI002636B1F8|nr:hypothetical protein [uncultured Roseobacter sp.]
MTGFDPHSSEVNTRDKTGEYKSGAEPTEDQLSNAQRHPTGQGAAKALPLLASKATRFLGLWALVTVLLVQTIKLFRDTFSFTENSSGILAVTFIFTAGVRYMASSQFNTVKVIAIGVVLERILRPIRSMIGTAWTFFLLGFIAVFIGQCSTSPNAPIEDVFIVSLDKYWSWLGQAWRKLLWHFGWL